MFFYKHFDTVFFEFGIHLNSFMYEPITEMSKL
jgi:hypothetical protein